MPDTIETIGDSAFEGCGFTGALELPKFVQLGERAFFGCNQLNNLILPEGATVIPAFAFAGCSGLSGDLVIPDGVESIGESAFEDCFGYDGGLYLPQELLTIGRYAFRNTNFSFVEISEKVTEIGEGAFDDGSESLAFLTPQGSYAWRFATDSGIACIDPDSFIFTEVTDNVIMVTANGNWHVESDADWLHLDITEDSGDSYVEFSMDPNPSSVSPRTATVRFICGESTSEVQLTQAPSEVLVSQIQISPLPGTARADGVYTVQAAITPSDATTPELDWSVSAPEIASIEPSQDGLSATVSFKKAGRVSLTATATDGSGVSDVESYVVTDEALVTDIKLENSTMHTTYEHIPMVIATVYPVDAANKDLRWTVSDEDIASIQADGAWAYLIYHKPGTVTVTATAMDESGISKSLVCTAPQIVPVTDISLYTMQDSTAVPYPSVQHVLVGKTYRINAKAEPTNATNRNITWSTSDDTVASIEQNSSTVSVTILQEGEAVVTATAADGSGISENVVLEATIPVESIKLLKTQSPLKPYWVGEQYVVQANVLPENAANRDLAWTCTDDSIVRMDVYNNEVILNIVGEGRCQITAASTDGSNKKITFSVWAMQDIARSVTIDGLQSEVSIGDQVRIAPTVLPAEIPEREFTWQSSDESIATVKPYIRGSAEDRFPEAEVTFCRKGSATITATATDGSDLSASWTFDVTGGTLVESIEIGLNEAQLKQAGNTYDLSLSVLPSDASNKKLRWEISGENLASIDERMKTITFNEGGTVTITAYATDGSGVQASRTFTVQGIVPMTGLELSPAQWNIKHDMAAEVGHTYGINANIIPSNTTNGWKIGLEWTSSDSSIVDIKASNHSAQLTFKKSGDVTITARTTDGSDFSASCTYHAVDPIEVSGIKLTPAKGNLDNDMYVQAEETYGVELGILPEDASGKGNLGIQWSSSADNLVSIQPVSYGALLTFHGAGDVTVTARSTTVSGIEDSVTYHVLGRIETTGIRLEPAPWNLSHDMKANYGKTYGITAVILPEDATDRNTTAIDWSASDADAVTIKPSGRSAQLTFLKAGDVTVTARVVGKETYTASVTYHVVGITKAQSVTLYDPITAFGDTAPAPVKGSTFRLNAKVLPAETTNKFLRWKSSDESIATVEEGGIIDSDANSCALVTFLKTGTVTITATTTDGTGLAAQYTYNVLDHVSSVSLNKSTLRMDVGSSERLTATVLPANARDKSVSWSSSNNLVASVNQNGEVYAGGKGSAVITATTYDGKKTATCQVTVIALVNRVELNKSALTLAQGKTETLVANVLPTYADNRSVTWSSSNQSVATVDGAGKVTAKVAGTAVITVASVEGGKTATCKVTVPAPAPVATLKAISPGLKRLTDSVYAYCYALSTGHINVYTNSSLNVRGTVTSGASTVNYIDGAKDEVWILGVGTASNNVNWAKVSYPAGNARKVAYVPLDQLVQGTATESKTSKTKYNIAMRRGGSTSSSHFVAAGDTVYLLNRDSAYCQILYPVSGGKWRIGWCTCAQYDGSGASTPTRPIVPITYATKTSAKGQEFIKAHEGYHLNAYKDPGGVPTIGWGHTAGVTMGMTITAQQAQSYFEQDLKAKEAIVDSFAKANGISFTQQQYDALVSMTYNLGNQPWQTSCRLTNALKKYKSGSSVKIPTEKVWECFATWHHIGSNDCYGLYNRRMNEARIFALGDYTRKTNWKTPYWLLDGKPGYEVPDGWVPDEYKNGSGSGSGSGSSSGSSTTGKDDVLWLESPFFKGLSTNAYAYCYALSDGRVTPYTSKTLTTPGTTEGASSSAYIDGKNDELWLMGVGSTNGKLWAYVSYPITGKNKRRNCYLPLNAIVQGGGVWSVLGNTTSLWKYYVSDKKSRALNYSHYVAPGDKVYGLSGDGGYCQIGYPVAGGKWRIAWCTTDQYNNKLEISFGKNTSNFDVNNPKVYLQTVKDYKTVQYGYKYNNKGEKVPAWLYDSGCGILSMTNAVNVLTGKYADPEQLAAWSVNNGHRITNVGTRGETFYPGWCATFGAEYGIKYDKKTGSLTEVKNHLKNGGVAVVSLVWSDNGSTYGHLVCIAAYDDNRGFLALDSYPSNPRGTGASGTRWLKDSDWKGRWNPGGGFFLMSRR